MAEQTSLTPDVLNRSAETESHSLWMHGCGTRSSSNILYLCLGTIVICLCTAFHDNIPLRRPQNRRLASTLLDSIVRILEFLFLPELLPAGALEQLREAIIVHKNVGALRVREIVFSSNSAVYH